MNNILQTLHESEIHSSSIYRYYAGTYPVRHSLHPSKLTQLFSRNSRNSKRGCASTWADIMPSPCPRPENRIPGQRLVAERELENCACAQCSTGLPQKLKTHAIGLNASRDWIPVTERIWNSRSRSASGFGPLSRIWAPLKTSVLLSKVIKVPLQIVFGVVIKRKQIKILNNL